MLDLFVFRPFCFQVCYPKNDSPCPKARSGHRIVCDQKSMFSFGGYNPFLSDTDLIDDQVWQEHKPLFKELWKFNFASKEWTRLEIENMPKELASNAILLKGSTLIIYGGTGVPFGSRCSNHVHILNMKKDNNMALIKVEGSLPEKLYGQAIALDENAHLYTMGGTTGYEYTSDIHRLDLRTSKWEDVHICHGDENEPEGRYRHEIILYDQKLWVLGGGTANSVNGFKEIHIFDLVHRRWEHRTTLPDPTEPAPGIPLARRCHGCVLLEQEDLNQHPFVFIIGGIGGQSGSQAYDNVWKLDLVTLNWHKMKKTFLPYQMYFHSTALTPSGCLYSFGGIEISTWRTERTAAIYKSWITIPKLSEICWEALLHYAPNLVKYDQKTLTNVGVPLEFVKRIH